MANEERLIYANKVLERADEVTFMGFRAEERKKHFMDLVSEILKQTTVDAVEVVRCQNCVHAEPLDRNCELSTTNYLHCKLWRGEETKNVWHKYKKYYKDYSLVWRDGYCDSGAKMDGGSNNE